MKLNKLHEEVLSCLKERGLSVTPYATTITYNKPARTAKYTPPFVLPSGLVIQTKGRFVTADRQKHNLIREQHPNLRVVFLFSNAQQRISSASATTYAMWCQRFGFEWACQKERRKAKLPVVPGEWA